MKNNKLLHFWKRIVLNATLFVLAVVTGATILPTLASAQTKKDETSFNLVANPAFVNCLRGPSSEEPRARATVIHGKLNDTLILDLDGIKPGLAFDLFTVQRSPFLSDGTPDSSFRNFGFAWYQSDIQIGKNTDDGHVSIRTILLDDIFGFDPDVALAPTNTFHLGFWFDNPQDAAACGFPANDPTKLTPFNGEHKAGPLAMISLPDPVSKLGPLCTNPDTSHTPATCNP